MAAIKAAWFGMPSSFTLCWLFGARGIIGLLTTFFLKIVVWMVTCFNSLPSYCFFIFYLDFLDSLSLGVILEQTPIYLRPFHFLNKIVLYLSNTTYRETDRQTYVYVSILNLHNHQVPHNIVKLVNFLCLSLSISLPVF